MSLKELLTKYAKSDLNKARKQCIIVADTKKGNLTVAYAKGTYTIMRFNLPDITNNKLYSEVLYQGKRAGAIEFLLNSYQVVVV